MFDTRHGGEPTGGLQTMALVEGSLRSCADDDHLLGRPTRICSEDYDVTAEVSGRIKLHPPMAQLMVLTRPGTLAET
ncbi:unnamed protein product [Arctogadus glacialis]